MKSQDGISGLFFGSLPNLEDLVAAKATIQTNKDDEVSPIQPMCCRELIFTESNVLVSPLLEERDKLFLITTKLTFQSCQFQELLQKLNIQNTEPVDLTRSLFQFCFSFTMKQKLAPLWNKAGEFLVQGRDFMQETSKLNAITLEVTISDKICIALQACSLKSTPCKPEHFTASVKALEEFNTNREAQISDAAISDDLCFVLPSLKKGRIFSITHKLPENCPFESYEELRKHWKLMYGYRLPPEENVFYNVHFYYIRGKVFTYPASCIRSSQALVSSRCDHQLIFSSFLKDLSCRMPAVCGAPLTLTSSPLYPTSSLKHATHTNHSNLTRSAPPQFSHCRPFSIQTQHTTQDSARQGVTTPPNSQLTSSQASSQTESSQRSNTVNPPLTSHIGASFTSTPFVPRFTSTLVVRADESPRTAPSILVRPSSSGTRIIPMFSRKRAQSHGKDTTGSKNSGHTAFARGTATSRTATGAFSGVPLVRSAVHVQNASFSVLSQNSPRVAERERTENVFEERNVRLEHTIPDNISFHTYQIDLEERSIDRGRFQGIAETPLLTSSHGRTIELLSKNSPSSFNRLDIPLARSPSPSTSTQVSKCLPQTRPGLVISQAPTGSHLAASSCTGNVLVTQGPARDIASPHMEQLSMIPAGNYSTLRGTPVSDISPGQLFEPFSTSFQSSGALARKRQINGLSNEDPAPKKPKSKPKLQENVDVRELAIQNQLHKANTVTLADWLKKRGVAVKSKDKKADLASKVKQHLGLIQHEQ